MPALSLARFRELKAAGFPGWETVRRPDAAEPYVSPADARYGGPSFPFGTDPAASAPAFERWCGERLVGDFYVTAGPWTGLVYCQLESDLAMLHQSFGRAA
jgi:hypothetical protein